MTSRLSDGARNTLKTARRFATGVLGYCAGLSPAKTLPITEDLPETPAIREYLRDLLTLSDRPTTPAAEPLLARMNAFPYWYQRIDFPDFGLSTAHAAGYMLEESDRAVRLTHPQLKWAFIRELVLAEIATDANVMELGSNAGFFSFEMARRADHVVAVEGLETYSRQFALCQEILASCPSYGAVAKRLEVVNTDIDFASLWSLEPIKAGRKITHSFTSDVIIHLRFPFLAIHQLLEVTSKSAFLDFELPMSFANISGIARLTVQPQSNYHHFFFSESLIDTYLLRIGVPASSISKFRYWPYHVSFNRQRRDMYRILYRITDASAHIRGPLQSSDDPGHRISHG
jgi:hypothetical protein